MFDSLINLTKAAASVALTPVAVAVDVLTLPATSMDLNRGPFDNTAALLKNAGECTKQALAPTTKD